MTTVATADLHVSVNPRDAYRWRFIEETLPALVEERRARRVLLLGDLTEQKDGHQAELVNRLVDAVARLGELAPVYVLKGNHDYVAEDSPFFRFLGRVPRVQWINEPTELHLRGLGSCLFLPYTRSLEDWVHFMDSYDWFFCHQTFGGADLGTRKAEGSAPPFSNNAHVVSGDVHVPQKVGPVTYVGAPYTVDFGDSFKPRVLLLREGRAPQSVPVPGPQKRLVVLSGRDPLSGLAMRHPISAGDVVKVRVELPAGSETSRAEARARVRAWAGEIGVDLYATEVVAPRAAAPRADRDRGRASDADLVRQYAKRMGRGKSTAAVGLRMTEEVL